MTHLRARQVRRRVEPRRRDARRLRPADGADALRQASASSTRSVRRRSRASRPSSSRPRSQKILPPGTQVRTGEAQATRGRVGHRRASLGFLQNFLLAFGGIALFVGCFVIANSLSITIAQRTREFATLRTLGATRRQVLGSVVIEALVDRRRSPRSSGVLRRLRARRRACSSSSTPSASRCRTTASSSRRGRSSSRCSSGSSSPCSRACARRCARRACRRSRPCAKARRCPRARFARYRTLASAILTRRSASPRSPTGCSAAASSTTQILVWMGIGTVLIFFGVALLSARIARPLRERRQPGRKLDGRRGPRSSSGRSSRCRTGCCATARSRRTAPAAALARDRSAASILEPADRAARARHVAAVEDRPAGSPSGRSSSPASYPTATTGALARDNSQRNPQRTASTASALMIGLALVTLVAVLAAGITSSFRGAVNDLWTDGYAITAEDNFSPIPIAAGNAAAQTPGVEAIAQRARRRRAGLRQDDPGDRPQPGGRRDLQPRLGRRLRRGDRRRSARTAPSSTRTTRRATTSKVGSPLDAAVADGHHAAARRCAASSTRRRAARRSAA